MNNPIYTLAEQLDNRVTFIKALRGELYGEFARVVTDGQFNRNGFTIGGVAAYIVPPFVRRNWDGDKNLEEDFYLSRYWLGFVTDIGSYLKKQMEWTYSLVEQDSLNKKSFAEIADIIESEPHGLVRDSDDLISWSMARRRTG